MTVLQIMSDKDASLVKLRTTDDAEIAAELAKRGVDFGRWPLMNVEAGTPTEDIQANYATHIEEMNADGRYKFVDIVRIHPDDNDPEFPAKAAGARGKFLDEHRHAEDEVRFFAAGQGCFYLHLGDEVLATVCTAGDLVSVPAGTLHWFDMGTRPEFVAVRFFEEEDGWVGDFTGDKISGGFPTLDELVAGTWSAARPEVSA